MAIKRLCREAGVERLGAGTKGATVAFQNNAFANPVGLIAFIQKQAGEVTLRHDNPLVYRRAWETEPARGMGVRQASEGRCRGTGWGRTCRSRWSWEHEK